MTRQSVPQSTLLVTEYWFHYFFHMQNPLFPYPRETTLSPRQFLHPAESRISEHCKVLIKFGCGASGDLQREKITYVFLLFTLFPLSRQWSSSVQLKTFVWRRAEWETAAPGPTFFWSPPDQALWKALSWPLRRWLGQTQSPLWEELPCPSFSVNFDPPTGRFFLCCFPPGSPLKWAWWE